MEAHEDVERDVVVDRITHHYVRAAELINELGHVEGLPDDLTERALRWLEVAAARASQAEIPVVAERLYEEGLRLLAGAHGPRHRAFLTGRARALAGLREIAPARADALAAVDESRQAGAEGRADLGRALLVLADVEQKESGWAASEAALDEAAAVFAELGDASGEAEVLRLRGFAALFRHEYAAATGLLEQALAGFEALDDHRGVAWARQNLAWCAFYAGRAEEAEMLLRKAAATFEEIGDQGGLRWAHGLLAWTRFQQGHTRRGRRDGRGHPRRGPPGRRPLGPRHDARAGRVGAPLDRPHAQRHRPAARGPRSVRGHQRRLRPRAGVGRPGSGARARRSRRRGPRGRRVEGTWPTTARGTSGSTSCR